MTRLHDYCPGPVFKMAAFKMAAGAGEELGLALRHVGHERPRPRATLQRLRQQPKSARWQRHRLGEYRHKRCGHGSRLIVPGQRGHTGGNGSPAWPCAETGELAHPCACAAGARAVSPEPFAARLRAAVGLGLLGIKSGGRGSSGLRSREASTSSAGCN